MATTEDYSARNEELRHLPLASVQPSKDNPRQRFDPERMAELTRSVEAQGVIEPILVRPIATDDGSERFEIIAGHSRWWASQRAKKDTILAVVKHGLSDNDAREQRLLENLIRTDLNAIEEANGFKQLMELGYTQRLIGERIGCDQSTVANRLRLLDLPEEVISQVRSKTLSPSHGKALLAYKNIPRLLTAMAELAATGVPVKEIEKPTWSIAHKVGAVRMDWVGEEFEQCNGCNSRKKIDNTPFCFEPECHQRLSDEKIQAQMEALRKEHGNDMPELRNLKHGTYQELRNRPEGCSPDCPDKGVALDYGNHPVDICTRPGCYNKLASAKNRAQAKNRRDSTEEAFAPAWALLDSRAAMDRATILVCIRAIKTAPVDAVRNAMKRSGIDVDIQLVKEYKRDETHQAFEEVAKLGAARAIALVAEIELQEEAREMRQSDYAKPCKLTWFLDKPPLMGTFDCPACGKNFPEHHHNKATKDGLTYCCHQCAQNGPETGKVPDLPQEESADVDPGETTQCEVCGDHFGYPPAMIDGLGAVCYGCKIQIDSEQTEDAAEPEEVYTVYVDSSDVQYFVDTGLGDDKWFILTRAPGSSGTHRVCSPNLPVRNTKAEAQRDLDAYAAKHGLWAAGTDAETEAASQEYTLADQVPIGSVWQCNDMPQWVVCVIGSVGTERVDVETLANDPDGSQRPGSNCSINAAALAKNWTELDTTRLEVLEPRSIEEVFA